MVTAGQIRKRLKEYELTQTVVSYFSGVAQSRISSWLNDLMELRDEEKEAIDVASSALASMIHMMYEIPIDLSKVKKLEPIVQKYMKERREYDVETRVAK